MDTQYKAYVRPLRSDTQCIYDGLNEQDAYSAISLWDYSNPELIMAWVDAFRNGKCIKSETVINRYDPYQR